MREMTFMDAAREGLAEEMARDDTIFVLGEGIGKRGGNFNTTVGLYDLEKDPHQLTNLAKNPEYAAVLEEMRSMEAEWVAENRDFGFEDLGKRQPESELGAMITRRNVKAKAPELWARLESGELMETQSWGKQFKSPKK